MVYILYAKLPTALPAGVYHEHLNSLPPAMINRMRQYRLWRDQLRYVWGKLLLMEALKKFLPGSGWLHKIRYNNYGRPFLDPEQGIDFNLSHSGDYIICAIGQQVRVGIDIEQQQVVDLKDFQDTMTADEWDCIKQSADPLHCFFQYWVKKESVIKADGRGLDIPLQSIVIKDTRAYYKNTTWLLQPLIIDTGYSVCLCTDKGIAWLEIQRCCMI